MPCPLSWETATELADHITFSPDGGSWHARVAVTASSQGYAVAVRQHNTHTWYHVYSAGEFIALCNGLMRGEAPASGGDAGG